MIMWDNGDVNDTLATRLLLSRRRVMNQDELARKANVRRGYISDLERGVADNPTVKVVEALARALNVRPEYLTCWRDDPLGEDLPANIAEGRVVYEARSSQERRRIEDVIEIMQDLAPERQELAVRVLEEFRNAQRFRQRAE